MSIRLLGRSAGLAACAATGALALAACGSSGTTSSSSSSSSSSSGAPAAASTTSSGSSAMAGTTVAVRTSSLGRILTDASGRTVYLWQGDHGSTSACSGACAAAWPPLTTHGAAHAGAGVDASKLATTKRSDGSSQVTYAGHPLYLFAGDSGPGQTSGQGSQGFGAPWYVVSASGVAVTGSHAATGASSSSSASGY